MATEINNRQEPATKEDLHITEQRLTYEIRAAAHLGTLSIVLIAMDVLTVVSLVKFFPRFGE